MVKRKISLTSPYPPKERFEYEIDEALITTATSYPVSLIVEYKQKPFIAYVDAQFKERGQERLPLLPGQTLCTPPCRCECPKPRLERPPIEIKGLSNTQLRNMASSLGLAISGNATELIRRIQKHQIR